MEEKKYIRISLGTVVCIVIIILLLFTIGGMYYYYNYISKESNNDNNINSNIINQTNENNTTTSTKYNEITDTLSGEKGLYVTSIEKSGDKYLLKGVIYDIYTLTQSEYDDIKNGKQIELYDNKYFSYTTTNSLYNENGDYLIADGEDYPSYKIVAVDNYYEIQATTQISNVWELTNEYMQIELDGSTTYTTQGTYEEDTNSNTIKDFYESFSYQEPVQDTNPTPIFNFKFENDKCIEMYQILTRV